MNDARIAVVTGAGRGLGRAIALQLAADGMDVAVLARSADEVAAVADEVRALGARAMALAVDVTSTDAVADAQAQIESELGVVDTLVNNAGNLLYKPFIPLPGLEHAGTGFDAAVSDDEWNGVLDVHLGGAVRMLRAFGPGMVAQERGRVVNIVSNVVRRGVPFTTSYDTAKAGLVQLTRSLAREWSRYGVTVNAVAAGHFPTRMTQFQFDDAEANRRMVQRIPMRRTGEPDELAGLVSYLCSERAGYVTGELIGIDGGETL